MDDDQTTIFTYISLAFLCVVLFLYITYGKNLMKSHRLFFFICLMAATITIVGLFTDQRISLVVSSLLLGFVSILIIIKIINKQKLKSVGLRSYRSFTVN